MSTTIRTSLIPGVPTLEVEMTLNRVAAFLILASVGYYSKNKRIQDACLQLHNEATVLLDAFSGSVSANEPILIKPVTDGKTRERLEAIFEMWRGLIELGHTMAPRTLAALVELEAFAAQLDAEEGHAVNGAN